MTRFLRFLPGPELLWLIVYIIVALMARANMPPTKAMNNALINLSYVIPFIVVPLTFALYFIPGVERSWLLARILIAGLFAAHWTLEKGLSAHGEQGPGVGTAYMMGMAFVLFMLVVGTVVIGVKNIANRF